MKYNHLDTAIAMAKEHFGTVANMRRFCEGPESFMSHFRLLAESHGITHQQAGVIAMCLIYSNEINSEIAQVIENG